MVLPLAIPRPRFPTKSAYASWIRYFDEGEGSHSRLILKALLAY